MSASADVLAQAKVEIDLAQIPEGKNVRLSKLSFPLNITQDPLRPPLSPRIKAD